MANESLEFVPIEVEDYFLKVAVKLLNRIFKASPSKFV